MRVPARSVVVLSAVAVLALSACGDDAQTDTAGSDDAGSPTASATPTTQADSPTESESPTETGEEDDGAVEVEVEIENGSTSPAGERVTVAPGQTIRLEVDSDMADELHLHADPEQTFAVKPVDGQQFEFSIDKPGVYELESHETGSQVISIQVQP